MRKIEIIAANVGAELPRLGEEELEAVRGGFGFVERLVFLSPAQRLLPPNPCKTVLGQ
jgi:hypothetical protein